jgi:hypothetical protein
MNVRHTSILAFGFLVACGGSAARDHHDSPSTNDAGAAGNDAGGTEGDGASGGTSSSGAVGAAGTMGGSRPSSGGSVAAGGHAGRPGNMGGTSAGPTLELPPGCEPRGRTETADTCSLAVYCDTASQLTNCFRLPNSDRWQCQCDIQHKDRIYQMENAPGLQACALAASLCSEDELDLGEETCEPSSENSAETNCRVDLTCAKPIELGPDSDAKAWLVRLGSAFCNEAQSGKSFDCGCKYANTESDYDLLVDSGAPDCRPLVDFCMSGASPDFTGEEQCLLTNTVSSSEGCERTEACANPMPLGGAVSLAKIGPRYANCTPRLGGGSDCYCSGRDFTFDFRLPDEPDNASCASSILNCAPGAVITATGSPSCEPTSSTSYADSCEADLDCLQDATVDDREIVAKGRLLVACARVQTGMPWWCSCASDQETAQFQMGDAQLSALQACGQGATECLDHLDVHVGPYGEYVQPPNPLP